MNNVDPASGPSDPASPGEISTDAIRTQLARITASRTFEHAPVLRQFLEHIVTATLAGKSDQLKEYALGIDVFGRGSFDPRVDTIVRVQARRLRAKLAEYYRTEGRDDAISVELPKGHYVPTFRRARPAETSPPGSAPTAHPARPLWHGLAMGLLIGVALTALVAGSSAVWRDTRPEPVAAIAGASEAERDVPGPSLNRVAIARFENRTGDSSLDALGHLVAERLIGIVTKVSGAEVEPRPVRPEDGDTDLPASLLVTGTYYVNGDRLELQARILEAPTGRLLHVTQPVTGVRLRPDDAIARLEQDVAGAVALHFDDFFGGLHLVSQPPTFDAYREYRAGLEIFQSDYARSMKHLEQSLETSPHFLLPLVIMRFAHDNLDHHALVEAVLARMEGLAESFTPAERLLVEFLRASWERRREQALRVLQDLERLAPDSLLVNFNLMQQSLATNRPRAAVEAYTRRPFNDRTLRHSIGTYRHRTLVLALHLDGAFDRELHHIEVAQRYAPGVLPFLAAEGRALVALGRVADALRAVDRSRSLPAVAGWPGAPGDVMEQIALELRAHGYHAESLGLATRAVDWYRARATDIATDRRHRAGLAQALYLAERWDEAGAVFSALADEYPEDVLYRGAIGRIAARVQDTTRALAIAEDLELMRRPDQLGRASYERARIAALLGDRQRAVDLLREALTQGLGYGSHLHHDPDLELLRDYPPYIELVRPIG